MNRRDMIVAGLSLLPSISGRTQTTESSSNVSVVSALMHYPNTRYVPLRMFPKSDGGEEGAIAFVKALRPKLYQAEVQVNFEDRGLGDVIASGYRGAIRSAFKYEVANTIYNIVDERDGKVIIGPEWDGYCLFNCERAWAVIENIRVNDKPVQMHEPNKIPLILTQPFIAKGCRVIYRDKDGKVTEVVDNASNITYRSIRSS